MNMSIVIPAYNEEGRIAGTIKVLYDLFASKKQDFEIIVVFDGSDRTPSIVRSFSKKNIIVMESKERRGKGRGVSDGVEAARGKRIGFIDADCPISPKEFYGMFEALDDADCVIASRSAAGANTEGRTFMRKLFSRAFNIYVNALFWLGVSDTQCGAKVFRSGLAKDIFKDVESRGFAFDVEILWRAKKAGARITEFPVSWKHVEAGTFNYARDWTKMFWDVLKLRFGGAR